MLWRDAQGGRCACPLRAPARAGARPPAARRLTRRPLSAARAAQASRSAFASWCANEGGNGARVARTLLAALRDGRANAHGGADARVLGTFLALLAAGACAREKSASCASLARAAAARPPVTRARLVHPAPSQASRCPGSRPR